MIVQRPATAVRRRPRARAGRARPRSRGCASSCRRRPRARRPLRPPAARCGVDRVDHERAAELRVRARDADARHLDAERAHSRSAGTLHRRAADDRADRDDAVAAGDERVADAGHREDRADRDDRVRRADERSCRPLRSASSTPGAGRAASAPSKSHARRPAARRARRTNHSCIASSLGAPSGPRTVMRVRTGSSVIGSRRTSRPHARAISAVTSESVAPARSRWVRKRCVARSLSPSRNQASAVVALQRVEASRTSRLRGPSPARRWTRRRACR